METGKPSLADNLAVFVAQGFGIGRVPYAPGTFGSMVGLLWIALLLVPQNLTVYLLGTIAGVFVAIWIGARAERVLNQKDPGSIVIDEIAALPIAFLPGMLAGQERNILTWVVTFALFRFFDVMKPIGIGRVQRLPGGWGLVLDDVLAGIVAALLLAIFLAVWR
jgi:phosphatidylglycerophosphatase A